MHGLKKKLGNLSLGELSDLILEKLNVDVKVNGSARSGKTIMVANHSSTILDIPVVVKALGTVDNLRIISREETVPFLPQDLRKHVIPVGIQSGLKRSKDLKKREAFIVNGIERIFPPPTDSATRKNNIAALKLAADFVAAGDNVLIFEPQVAGDNLPLFIKKFLDPYNQWPSGVGWITNNIIKAKSGKNNIHIQPIGINYTAGDRQRPFFSRNEVTVIIGKPTSIKSIAVNINDSNGGRGLTKNIQAYCTETLSKSITN